MGWNNGKKDWEIKVLKNTVGTLTLGILQF